MSAAEDRLPVSLRVDCQALTQLFQEAHDQGRDFLYEYEAYEFMRHIGAETTPQTHLIARGQPPGDQELLSLPGDRVVLKIVSPHILHKTEVGGVRVVPKSPERIRSAWRRMLYEVPDNLAALIQREPDHAPPRYRGLEGPALVQAIAGDLTGVLMVQYMPPDSEAFGNEMIVGLRRTREFGMIISAGLGGTDTELYARRFRKGQAIVASSTALTDGHSFFKLFQGTISYRKLAGLTRGQKRIVTDEQLLECFAALIQVANHFSPLNPDAPFVIDELEYNPFAFTDYLMVPLDGLAKFSLPGAPPRPRPVAKIRNLLRPGRIGVVGVSTTRENFGRVILDNILAAGFPAADVRILRPGLEAFAGVRCVPDLASLDGKLDLLVVAVSSAQVPELVAELVERDAAEAVILIPGGLGETADSQERARCLGETIARARRGPGGGPVFLGGNSLGVLSHPGRYDTLFIPQQKVAKSREIKPRNGAFVSQSGAFMMTRVSRRPELDPAYLISAGNQNDLTLGDLMEHLGQDPEIGVIGVYAEGFQDLDGLDFSRAVRQAVLAGKDVVFYKAGRTPEGKKATSGHTASLAGDYMVCESCVRQAGGMVAGTLAQFEDLFLMAQKLNGKQVGGNRLALISAAGFEAVCMADHLEGDDYRLKLAHLAPETAQGLATALAAARLGGLVEVKNPLDVTPGGDDATHLTAVELMAADPGVDAVVVSLCPVSPGLASLDAPADDPASFRHPASIAVRLPELAAGLAKPVVGVADAGRIYDPYVAAFASRGMVVLPTADRAVATLGLYIENRLYAQRLRQERGL